MRYTPTNGSPMTVDLKNGFAVVGGRSVVLTSLDVQYPAETEERETVNRSKRSLVLGFRPTVMMYWDLGSVSSHLPIPAGLVNKLMEPGQIVEMSLDANILFRPMSIVEGLTLQPYGGRTIAGLRIVGPKLEAVDLIASMPSGLLGSGGAW